MRVLVTGGAGYIGSVTSEILLRAGHQVLVFDSLVNGHRAAVPDEADFVQGDLLRPADLRTAFDRYRPEAVMHCAGNIQAGESMEHPFKYLGDNVNAGLNLLRATVDSGVTRFIFSSTANLFDKPKRIPIDESAAINPGSPYGEAKYYLERVLSWLDRTSGLRSVSLRYFNAAGATPERGEDHDPETHLVPRVLNAALGKGEPIQIFGDDYETPDGTCIRDYIHVSDLAEAHALALRALDTGSRVYNLGNGRGFSVKEVIETARRITGRPIPAIVAPRRAGDVPCLVADSARIRQELGWAPRRSDLKSMIVDAWEWRRNHPDGYLERA